MNARNLLMYLSYKYKGNFSKMLDAIKAKEKVTDEEVNEAIENNKSNYITILDSDYPESFKKMNCPPLVLYYKGNKNLLNDKTNKIAIVGTKDASTQGINITKDIINNFEDKHTVISNYSNDCFSICYNALKTSLENKNTNSVTVLGAGINYYKDDSLLKSIAESEKGLILTEYPDEVEPSKETYAIKNRLIAGLSNQVLVTEAHKGNDKSSLNLIIFYALQNGKDVMAIPYDPKANSMCNDLIKDGAIMVENAEDIELNTTANCKEKQKVEENEIEDDEMEMN